MFKFRIFPVMLILMLAFAFTGCDDGSSSNPGQGFGNQGSDSQDSGDQDSDSQGTGGAGAGGTGGTFTLNNIPQKYNGKYAVLLQYGASSESEEAGFVDSPQPSQSVSPSARQVNDEDTFIIGAQNINISNYTLTGVLISNGRVNLPMWTVTGNRNPVRYSGNNTFSLSRYDGFMLMIFEKLTLTVIDDYYGLWELSSGSIAFANGNATKSWTDGEEIDPNWGGGGGGDFFGEYPGGGPGPGTDRQILSLNVQMLPTKTIYQINEHINLAGIEVLATLNDGTWEVITDSSYFIADYDFSTPGSKTVTLTPKDNQNVSTSFEVTVVN